MRRPPQAKAQLCSPGAARGLGSHLTEPHPLCWAHGPAAGGRRVGALPDPGPGIGLSLSLTRVYRVQAPKSQLQAKQPPPPAVIPLLALRQGAAGKSAASFLPLKTQEESPGWRRLQARQTAHVSHLGDCAAGGQSHRWVLAEGSTEAPEASPSPWPEVPVVPLRAQGSSDPRAAAAARGPCSSGGLRFWPRKPRQRRLQGEDAAQRAAALTRAPHLTWPPGPLDGTGQPRPSAGTSLPAPRGGVGSQGGLGTAGCVQTESLGGRRGGGCGRTDTPCPQSR